MNDTIDYDAMEECSVEELAGIARESKADAIAMAFEFPEESRRLSQLAWKIKQHLRTRGILFDIPWTM